MDGAAAQMDAGRLAALAADPRAQAIKVSLMRSNGKDVQVDVMPFVRAVCDHGLGQESFTDVMESLFLTYSEPRRAD